MEFESPLSQFKAIKKATIYFETKVQNTQIKEQPLSRKDPQHLEIGVRALLGEIFWMKIDARRTKEKKTSIISIKGRPGTMHLFLSAIVVLMAGPFLYMGFQSGNAYPYVASGFFALLGLASLIMPFIRLRKTSRALQAVLTSEEELEEVPKRNKGEPLVSSRIQ
ncbi:MAG: hypothetical protein K9W42_10950 [Candidatus Heimdallarchaeota archaeon]|nr:hypothetical protein [Candidatus Heimdallarchaeota archaeon]